MALENIVAKREYVHYNVFNFIQLILTLTHTEFLSCVEVSKLSAADL